MKIKRKFKYDNIEMLIVEREESYTNRVWKRIRVLAPNGGCLPLIIQSNWTLKKIKEEAILMLDGFKKRGYNVVHELTN